MMEIAYLDNEPILMAKMKSSAREFDANFFVDSGADTSIIPFTFARLLGFDKWTKDELSEAVGIGKGKVRYFLRPVRLEVGDFDIPMDVACSIRDDVPFLLGRKGFFEHFVICFDEVGRKIILNRR